MDSFDFHIAQQKTKDRNTNIAIAVFIFVILLLIILCVLIKYMFDRKEKKIKPPIKFNVNKVVPDFKFPLSSED